MVAIYVLKDHQGTIFYVGATISKLNQRLSGHIAQAKNKAKAGSLTETRYRHINWVLDTGGYIEIMPIGIAEEKDAALVEQDWYNRLTAAGVFLAQSEKFVKYNGYSTPNDYKLRPSLADRIREGATRRTRTEMDWAIYTRIK